MGTLSHFTAFLSAFPTSFGALSAMIHVVSMFSALGSTGFTKVGAKLTDISCMGTTTGHESDGHITNPGAIAVEPNAVDHHFYIHFA
ncbi:hypothetical protein GCM10027085_63300 [Spirosoma aerophilum]